MNARLNELLGVLRDVEAALDDAREWKLATEIIGARVEIVSMADEIERLHRLLRDVSDPAE